MADADDLAALAARTFRETFADDNTPTDMEVYLASTFAPRQLRLELADSCNTFLLACAECHASPVGYAKLRDGVPHSSISGPSPVELERVYVLRDFIRMGIGAALMKTCFEEAVRAGNETVWLGVWERNPRAIEFYRRLGFREVGSHTFVLGFDQQNDLIMARSALGFE